MPLPHPTPRMYTFCQLHRKTIAKPTTAATAAISATAATTTTSDNNRPTHHCHIGALVKHSVEVLIHDGGRNQHKARGVVREHRGVHNEARGGHGGEVEHAA